MLAIVRRALYNCRPHLRLIGARRIITIGDSPGDRQAFATDLGTGADKPGMLAALPDIGTASLAARKCGQRNDFRWLVQTQVGSFGLAQSMLYKGRFERTIHLLVASSRSQAFRVGVMLP